jgi:hypothetical protein
VDAGGRVKATEKVAREKEPLRTAKVGGATLKVVEEVSRRRTCRPGRGARRSNAG